MEFTDKMIECGDELHDQNVESAGLADTGKEFLFSADEQSFFAEKGFSDPQRCPTCRAAKKSRFNAGRSADRQMYSVTCADCGREDQVPFQPKGDRPVYCSDCFANHRPA